MTAQLFIDGSWSAAVGGRELPVIDPATEEVFAFAAAASADDVDKAVRAARRAFDDGRWRNRPGRERGVVLRAIAEGIRGRIDAIAHLEVRDNGKPLAEARWDIEDAAGCFDFYAELAETADETRTQPIALPDERFTSRVVHEPVGVVGAIIPWNYPLLMAAWKVAPALAAGCTIVLKPSELTPLTAIDLGRIAEAAGLPAGVLNVVTGYGTEAGQPLAAHPGVDKLAFTGSLATGSKIMGAAAQDIKRISLELGGKSPFIVFADSDLEDAVEWIMFGIFWNQGQVCSATSRVLVERPLYARLLERLATESRNIRIGSGLQPETKLGPLVSGPQRDKVLAAIARAKSDGAKVVTGGGRPAGFEKGYFFEPTILVDAPFGSPAWREEIFGPVVCVAPFDTADEAVALANDSKYGLAAAVMSADLGRCDRIAARLQAGIVWINCSQPTFTQAPWGGYKQSGIGRELGRWGFDNYLEVKQVTTFAGGKWGWYLGR